MSAPVGSRRHVAGKWSWHRACRQYLPVIGILALSLYGAVYVLTSLPRKEHVINLNANTKSEIVQVSPGSHSNESYPVSGGTTYTSKGTQVASTSSGSSRDYTRITRLPYNDDGLKNKVTIVTAYFNLGSFAKRDDTNIFTPELYFHWMQIFSHIHNPLIVYMDTKAAISQFKNIRKDFFKHTKIIYVSKPDMWSFQLYSRIANIYSDTEYPKHLPNTVNANYSCAMHAKHECMLRSVVHNPFRTKYFAWLDIGYFRDILQTGLEDFSLWPPIDFDQNKVGFSLIESLVPCQFSPKQIFYDNLVWVSGGFFIAQAHVMFSWAQEYIRATEYFLSQGLMNTDQQVILAMHCDHNLTVKTSLQFFNASTGNPWFYLGYLCRKPVRYL